MILDIRESAIDKQAWRFELFGMNACDGFCYFIFLTFGQRANVLDLVVRHLESMRKVSGISTIVLRINRVTSTLEGGNVDFMFIGT